MTLFVIVGSVLCAWAFLNVLGAERAGQLNSLKSQIRAQQAPPPPPPAPKKPTVAAIPAQAKPAPPPAKAGATPAKSAGAPDAKKTEKSKR